MVRERAGGKTDQAREEAEQQQYAAAQLPSSTCGPAGLRSRGAYACGHVNSSLEWEVQLPRTGARNDEMPGPSDLVVSNDTIWFNEGAGFALAHLRRSDQFAGGSMPPLPPLLAER